MEKEHKDRLRGNLVVFGNDLQVTPQFINCLDQGKILSSHDVEVLQNPTTTMSEKASWLMRQLSKKGPSAFDVFYNSLVHTEQNHLADTLKPTEMLSQGRASITPPSEQSGSSLNAQETVTLPQGGLDKAKGKEEMVEGVSAEGNPVLSAEDESLPKTGIKSIDIAAGLDKAKGKEEMVEGVSAEGHPVLNPEDESLLITGVKSIDFAGNTDAKPSQGTQLDTPQTAPNHPSSIPKDEEQVVINSTMGEIV